MRRLPISWIIVSGALVSSFAQGCASDQAERKALQEQLDALKRELSDIKASAAKPTAPPPSTYDRSSLSADVNTPFPRAGEDAPAAPGRYFGQASPTTSAPAGEGALPVVRLTPPPAPAAPSRPVRAAPLPIARALDHDSHAMPDPDAPPLRLDPAAPPLETLDNPMAVYAGEAPRFAGKNRNEPSESATDAELLEEAEPEAPEPPRKALRVTSADEFARIVEGATSTVPAAGPAAPRVPEALLAAPSPAPKSKGSTQELYQAGLAALKAHDHEAALRSLQAAIDASPKGDLADNALYWMGETEYDQGHYAEALSLFHGVLKRYPLGNKVPDAMVKAALCLQKSERESDARDLLEQVVSLYPGTDSARVAQARLADL